MSRFVIGDKVLIKPQYQLATVTGICVSADGVTYKAGIADVVYTDIEEDRLIPMGGDDD